MAKNISIYSEMMVAGVEIDHHCTDLYVPVNEVTTSIIDRYEFKCNVTKFRSAIDGTPWYDIPFAYTPAYHQEDS